VGGLFAGWESRLLDETSSFVAKESEIRGKISEMNNPAAPLHANTQ